MTVESYQTGRPTFKFCQVLKNDTEPRRTSRQTRTDPYKADEHDHRMNCFWEINPACSVQVAPLIRSGPFDWRSSEAKSPDRTVNQGGHDRCRLTHPAVDRVWNWRPKPINMAYPVSSGIQLCTLILQVHRIEGHLGFLAGPRSAEAQGHGPVEEFAPVIDQSSPAKRAWEAVESAESGFRCGRDASVQKRMRCWNMLEPGKDGKCMEK